MKNYYTLYVFIHYSALVHYELWHNDVIKDRGHGYWLPETFGLEDINFDFPISNQAKHLAFTASLKDLASKEVYIDGNGDNPNLEVGLYDLITDNFTYVSESVYNSMKVIQATLVTNTCITIPQVEIRPIILSGFSGIMASIKNIF